jgi:hypothetical protein
VSTLDKAAGIIGVLAALAAAGLWLRTSVIDVPNNIDTIVGELQRMGRWNAWAAFASFVAALCGLCLVESQLKG